MPVADWVSARRRNLVSERAENFSGGIRGRIPATGACEKGFSHEERRDSHEETLAGPMDEPAGELYTTTARLGGLTPGLMEASETVVATLRLIGVAKSESQ